MHRTVLQFSLRMDTSDSLSSIAGLVEVALGCRFLEGDYHEVPALVTELLGMKVGLFDWCGVGGREIVRLQSYVNDVRFVRSPTSEKVDIVKIDISQAIVDLLEVRGAGQWYAPTPSDLTAERQHGDLLAARFRAHDQGS